MMWYPRTATEWVILALFLLIAVAIIALALGWIRLVAEFVAVLEGQ